MWKLDGSAVFEANETLSISSTSQRATKPTSVTGAAWGLREGDGPASDKENLWVALKWVLVCHDEPTRSPLGPGTGMTPAQGPETFICYELMFRDIISANTSSLRIGLDFLQVLGLTCRCGTTQAHQSFNLPCPGLPRCAACMKHISVDGPGPGQSSPPDGRTNASRLTTDRLSGAT